ncbi:MAG TPA: folylpolyglutamate synthase/dihydrofolate synthase family protein [Gemmatimonadaceae bacterium]|nr:folylpolyglutamate synthase/dihydrofolate synthase family protein [Gemmatimonadaceae bacterium]
MDDLLTSYSAAIDALFARTTGNTKFGLERTEALLEKLGAPHNRLFAIHVAGTNGKGSVVATCEALLRATGRRVGRYTSPHLVDFRERITVDGKPISEKSVLAFLETWTPYAEEIGATFFELTTALAFEYFARSEVDVAVIETGLGGRLDSTNVLTPKVATVTSIGLDHTDVLGDTLEKIAAEKAGIFKKGVPAVIGEGSPPIRRLLKTWARDAGATPVIAVDDELGIADVKVSEVGTSFAVKTIGGRDIMTHLDVNVTTPLLGDYQARNTATAIATLQALGDEYLPSPDMMTTALSGVFLPGRFQRRGKFVFDVAHNPAGARAVASTLTAMNLPTPRTALIAVLADKDWKGIITELAPAIDRFLFTHAPSAPSGRRWDPADAHAYANENGFAADLEPDLDTAIERGQKRCGTLLVTGSFHTVGDVMSRLQVSPFAA